MAMLWLRPPCSTRYEIPPTSAASSSRAAISAGGSRIRKRSTLSAFVTLPPFLRAAMGPQLPRTEDLAAVGAGPIHLGPATLRAAQSCECAAYFRWGVTHNDEPREEITQAPVTARLWEPYPPYPCPEKLAGAVADRALCIHVVGRAPGGAPRLRRADRRCGRW
jgi:hypothetical protein